MIRFLRAFVWLRWRLLVNALKGGKRRDVMEDLSRATAVALPAILMLFFAAAAASAAWFAFHGGRLLGSGGISAGTALFPARLILVFLLLTALIVPFLRSMQGSTLGVARFLLLPVPRRALHLVEVAAGLFDPWILAFIPGLLLFPAGIAAGGKLPEALVALAAGCAFLGLCVSLGGLVSFLTFWLLRERRRAETATLVFMLLLMMTGFLPMFLDPDIAGRPRPAGGARRGPASIEQFDASLPAWSAAVPSEIYARAVGAGFDGSWGTAAILVPLLLAQASIVYGISSSLHARLLDAAEIGGARRKNARHETGDWRIPLLSAGAAAVAATQVRASLRTLVGRIALLGAAPMVFVIGLLLGRARELTAGGVQAAQGHLVAGVGIFFALLTLQPILMNQLASDRSGLTLQLLAPVSDHEIVFGKATGGLLLFGACCAASVAGGVILGPGRSILPWLSVVLAGISTYLWTAPVGAALSVLFPKASNLGTLGPSGKAHGAAQLLGSLSTFVAAAPPALMLLLPSRLTERPALGLLLMSIWTLLAAAAALPLLGAAARLLPARRENLALVAQSR